MIPFLLITHSAGKVAEFERILGFPVERYGMDLPEIQAIHVDQVVCAKVEAAYRELQRPVMVEDTGLYFEAWNGLPGALVKWFVESVTVHGMCRMLAAGESRHAWAETVIACFDGHHPPRLYGARVEGHIASSPRGNAGFGWDALFVPDGTTRTFAEMSPAEKDQYSMRRRALDALREGRTSRD